MSSLRNCALAAHKFLCGRSDLTSGYCAQVSWLNSMAGRMAEHMQMLPTRMQNGAGSNPDGAVAVMEFVHTSIYHV